MEQYQDWYSNTLSEKIKERMLVSWQQRYQPTGGGRRPLILDGGMEVDSITNVNFKELDFQTSIEENEKIILKALGIPPIMMDSGNNANIRPNMRMYYLETILPIVRKINHAMERYFGFELFVGLLQSCCNIYYVANRCVLKHIFTAHISGDDIASMNADTRSNEFNAVVFPVARHFIFIPLLV